MANLVCNLYPIDSYATNERLSVLYLILGFRDLNMVLLFGFWLFFTHLLSLYFFFYLFLCLFFFFFLLVFLNLDPTSSLFAMFKCHGKFLKIQVSIYRNSISYSQTVRPKLGNREKHQRKHGKYAKKLGRQ